VRFGLDADQLSLQVGLRGFLGREYSLERVRAAIETPAGHDIQAWHRMARELGLHGIAIPERFGGSGATFMELGVVLTELGRAAVPGPFFSTVVLAANALLRSGDEKACRTWLPGIVDGQLTATVVMPETPVRDGQLTTHARRAGSGWILEGAAHVVLDGADADLVLALAATAAGPTLFAVAPGAPGVERTRLESFDLTRRWGSLAFDGAAAEPVGEVGTGAEIVVSTAEFAMIGLACEQVGGAARCLDSATEYAKTRMQFGRPIGAFQSIKHMLADVLLSNEIASAAAECGAWTIALGPGGVSQIAALCKAVASDAFLQAAKVNIQVHGAIGFTWEHNAHLYFRRATSSRQFLGAPDVHHERLAAFQFATVPERDFAFKSAEQ
jgi:alkylation response protein AidB-like acyl-CoA dehydrogenase